jgi:hypothetical protein
MRRFSALELLVSLVFFIVAAPFLNALRHGELIRSALLTLVLLSAVAVVAESRRMLIIAVVLATPALAGKWANHFRPDLVPAEFFLIPSLVFVLFAVLHLLRFILRVPRVDAQVLSAAASNYLMIGLFWTFVYLLLVEMAPDAFSVSARAGSEGLMDAFNALYFSFVTLNTLGYGDITPVSRLARMLSILEATTGMFYMSMVIARLVAIYSSERIVKGRD